MFHRLLLTGRTLFPRFSLLAAGFPRLLKQLKLCVSHSESSLANPGPSALISLHFMPNPRAPASSREHWQGSSEQGISACES